MADFKVTPVPRHLAVTIAHDDAYAVIMTLFSASRLLEVDDDVADFGRALAAGYVSNGGELPEPVVDWIAGAEATAEDDTGATV